MMEITNKILRKAQLTGILERICQGLELSQTQFESAKSRYEAVGRWLADSADPRLAAASIYPQGSAALLTTVKPLGSDEHDVDLVCFLSSPSPYDSSRSEVKRLIGERLRQNGRYKDILRIYASWVGAHRFQLSIQTFLHSRRGERYLTFTTRKPGVSASTCSMHSQGAR